MHSPSPSAECFLTDDITDLERSEFVVGRLYANVLLATLNAREKVRQLEFDGDLGTIGDLPWIMDGEALSLGLESEDGDRAWEVPVRRSLSTGTAGNGAGACGSSPV